MSKLHVSLATEVWQLMQPVIVGDDCMEKNG